MTTDLEKENEMLRSLVIRLQKDKDLMYNNALELQDEVDYLKSLLREIKEVLHLDDEVDGYEIVLALEKEFR